MASSEDNEEKDKQDQEKGYEEKEMIARVSYDDFTILFEDYIQSHLVTEIECELKITYPVATIILEDFLPHTSFVDVDVEVIVNGKTTPELFVMTCDYKNDEVILDFEMPIQPLNIVKILLMF